MSDKNKIPAPELHAISLSKLRDFSTLIPKYPVCALCGNNTNKECNCKIYICKCNVSAVTCIWPECICEVCLTFKKNCDC